MATTRRRPRYTEALEQRLLVKRLRLDPRTRDLPWTAVPNGMHASKVQAALAKADGMQAGVPDLLLFVAGTTALAPYEIEPGVTFTPTEDVVGLALECKRPDGTGRVSERQARWHAMLRANGWRVEVVTTAAEGWRVITDHLGIPE